MDDMNDQSGQPTADPTDGSTRQQTGPRVSGDQMRDVDRLRRSGTDRYIAGVAGGLGRHFDIDPTVIRVVLAVLTFFGGAGLLVYVAVWLFVPEDGHDQAPIEVTTDVRRIILIVTGVVALSIVFGTPFFGHGWGYGFPVPLLIIGLVAFALFATRDRRRNSPRNQPPVPWGTPPAAAYAATQEGTTMSDTLVGPPAPGSSGYDSSAAPTYGAPGQQPPAWMPPPAPGYVPPPRPRRTGLVLFWPTLALIAIALGTLGIFDTSSSVTSSAYAALAVAITGVMLLIGAFVGRPGGLIALGLAASLGLGITSAVDAATNGDTRGENLTATPTTSDQVKSTYRVPNGSLHLDMSNVKDTAALDGRRIEVRLNAGDIDVELPPGVNAVVAADVELAGAIDIGAFHRDGFGPSLTRTVTGSTSPNAPTIALDIDARVGQITVEQN
jgi:phage shock protein PspC (stress-responsive transcriptional regulator)